MPNQQGEHKLTVRFEELGVEESRTIKSFSIKSSYLTSTDGFEFTFIPRDLAVFRDLECQPVELLIDGKSQLVGRIDKTRIGNDGVAVTCEGRDYIADIVECNVDPTFIVKESTTLGDAILEVCAPCGISELVSNSDLAIQNLRSGTAHRIKKGGSAKKARRSRKPKDPLRDYKPRTGEGAYEYCNRMASRHGATLQPSNKRSLILLDEPDYEQEPIFDIHITAGQRGGTRNNVQSAEAVRDYSRFPTFCLATGRQAGRAAELAAPGSREYQIAKYAEGLTGEAKRILSAARVIQGRQKPGDFKTKPPQLYRFLHVEDNEARTLDELDFAALRAVAERYKDTLQYTVKFVGHTDPATGSLYTVNTMGRVIDEVRGIDEMLWVAERSIDFTPSQGATCDATLWRAGAFQIEPK